jgi:hypothetical protein
VAKAEVEALPAEAAALLGVFDDLPTWRLRPIAVYR